MAKRMKLGEYLVKAGVLNNDQLAEALKVRKGRDKKLGEVLVELNLATEDDVARALAQQQGMEYIDLDAPDAIDASKFELIDRKLIKKYQVVPVDRQNGTIKVLYHDPFDIVMQDDLALALSCRISLALGAKSKIRDFINVQLQETKESIDDAFREISMDRGLSLDRGASMDRGFSMDRGGSMDRGFSIDEDGNSIDRGSSMDRGASMDRSGMSVDRGMSIDRKGGKGKANTAEQEAAIVRLVNKVIAKAVKERASDIHIEPMKDRIRVRYRIDGVCQEQQDMPGGMKGPLVTRFKIMSGMKLDEKRIPQDGRIKLRIGKDTIDFRVSACPAYHGESIVLRILRPDAVRIGLTNLGFEPDTLARFNKSIRRPNGIFLVTGPTGSGKTTTLYSALDKLNRPDRKIITAEDPVEYNFTGINQCQIREQVGFTFASALRSMLRQAPNIILVGEIRDKEVAEVAIQAALTGHLVFSTLHTNDAPSAITRLIDMGVKPFLVASSVQAVLAQRLIRALCNECKAPDDKPNPFYLKLIGLEPHHLEGKTIFKPVGCPACSNSGYKGRRGIYEYMQLNSEIREMTLGRASSTQIRASAIATGMNTLVDDGRMKVLRGVTSPAEIARVAQMGGTIDMEEEGTQVEDEELEL